MPLIARILHAILIGALLAASVAVHAPQASGRGLAIEAVVPTAPDGEAPQTPALDLGGGGFVADTPEARPLVACARPMPTAPRDSSSLGHARGHRRPTFRPPIG